MKHRIIAVSLVALAVSAGNLVAQGAPAGQAPAPGQGQAPGRGPGGMQRRMQALLQGITLTPEQQARMDSINTRYQAQMPAMTPGTPPDSATRAQRMQLGQQRDAELRAVLTAEQQTVWDRNVEQVRAQMQQRGPGN